MNSLKIYFVLSALLLGGCSTARLRSQASDNPATQSDSMMQKAASANEEVRDVQESQSLTTEMNRKIIKTAELQLEVASPTEVQRRIGSIAEASGGFVVSSQVKQQEVADNTKQQVEVGLVVRVPVSSFDTALNEIRGTANRVMDDKVSGQDVTEEFIDLEARIKTQKALETQFLEIMKRASEVTDALEVQRQVAAVRTDIERLEGRKRFLDNQAGLSTINVSLRTPVLIAVNSASFSRSIKDATATSVDLATKITLGLIQLIIVSIPLLVMIVLPGALIGRYFIRRSKRHQLARELESVAPAS